MPDKSVRTIRGRAKDVLPLSLVQNICPSCAERMRAKGLTGIKLSWLRDEITCNADISSKMLMGLCDYVGNDPGFFTTCMETDFGEFDPGNKEGFCAWLHHACEGRWPAEDKEQEGKGTHNAEPRMITNRVVKQDGEWYVKSEDGKKNLGGPYDSEEEAKKRLQQVEYFKHNSLQTITTNLKPVVRHDTLEGKDYLVVPMVMLTEGVHAGSNGPLLYKGEDLGKTPEVWNHKPIVVYHPQMNGQAISACDPDVINTRKVGLILRTNFDDGKLRAEAWLDADRLRVVDDRILKALESGSPTEVSTGLFTDNDDEEGEWNGEKYTHIARNFRPDHLAILPDQKGACSLEDGAGLLRNQADRQEAGLTQRVLTRALELVKNEMSQGEVAQQLAALLQPKDGTALGVPSPWPTDVYDTFFVYAKGNQLFKQGYKKEGDKVSLSGSPQEVVRVTSYKTLDGTVVNRKENRMDRQKVIEDLITNEALPWDEDDREFLEGLDDARLQKLIAPAPTINQAKAPDDITDGEQKKWDEMDEDQRLAWLKSRKPPTKNEGAPPKEDDEESVEDYIDKAPASIRDMLQEGLAAHNAEKKKLITGITANKANRFTTAQLGVKTLGELRAIAALAIPKRPAINYVGQADAVEPVTTNAEEPLTAPQMTFDE